jgi:hypothetical protein
MPAIAAPPATFLNIRAFKHLPNQETANPVPGQEEAGIRDFGGGGLDKKV